MSKKISEMPPKVSMADADEFTILDSEDAVAATKNKRVLRSAALADRQPVAPAGNQLGADGAWTPAGDSATLDVGTGAGNVAAGDAPAVAVTSHESTFAHANIPTPAQKAGLDNATTAPSALNPFVTEADVSPGTTLHADLTDLATSGHPGGVITIPAGVTGNAVSIAADGSLQDSGVPPGGAGGVTNLSNTPSAIEVTIESSSGTDTSVAGATGSLAGVLVAADKAKLDGIEAGAEVNTVKTVTGELSVEVQNTAGDHVARLVNDESIPGNSKYYGTDGAGTRGFFDLPAGGGVPSDVTLDGYVETEDLTLTSSAGTLTVPLDGRPREFTLTENTTLAATAPGAGIAGSCDIVLIQAATAYTLAYPAGWLWPDGTPITMPTGDGDRLYLSLIEINSNVYARGQVMS